MKLSERVRGLKPSATLAVNAKAKEMKAKGIDVINLSAGEPDFDTPEHIKEAAVKALKEGYTRYLPAAGLPELKEAVCYRLKEDYGFDYEPQEVVICCGAKHAIYNLVQALFDPGDEVLVLSPYWVSYPPIVELAGARPVVVPAKAEKNFEPEVDELKQRISQNTRGIILNSPSNPTGCVFSEEFLKEVARLVKEHELWVISDDIYDKLRFDGKGPQNILSVAPELRDRVIMVNGVSKTYAMTGWRIGWAVGPKEVITAVAKLQGQSTSNATSFAQKASVAALLGPQEFVENMKKTFAERASFLYEALAELEGVKPVRPQGTFYLFADFSSYYGSKVKNSVEMAEYLLDEARVATVPGVAFGEDGFLRVSFTQDVSVLGEAVARIKKALEALR